ncbi:peptidase S41 [Methylovorus sp. MM2]|uniref:S41 family peptidase n=1 Tax=Methylovorus sp. MM2 TaxID=1848038 RepID=UPI0007E178E3|nr:S41 family peptidase [Methylovorus sp. MM2]OAM51626.1 peptidase S41 [Methylovorus sp. MM2]
MHSKFNKFGLITVSVAMGVMLSLTYSAIADKETKSELPLDDLRAFAEVFGKIKSDYVEPVEDKKLISEAINGMLSGLDPHSAYLDADAFKDLQAGTQGEFGGLGIEVGMEDGFVKVVSPIEDTPAYKAGIKSGDLIVKLDDTPVKGMTLNDAVKRMRGKPNTPITLTILRKGEAKPVIVTVTRAIIKTQSVKYKLTEPGYAYVRITQFQEHTGEDLAKALKTMHDENKGPFKGLILDLRNNPGGLLNAAVGVSAAFIPKGELVVYTEGRTEDAKMRLTANPENYVRGGVRDDYLKDEFADIKTVPMAILVNGGSASASEIVAGALQDHQRAIIMGTQSFGKGSVQTILPMNNGTAIKLTTARYFTPKGRSIQAKGIVPDITVEEGTVSTADSGINLREADLTHHLTNPKDGEVPATEAPPAPAIAPATAPAGSDSKEKSKDDKDKSSDKPAPLEPGSKSDYQFNQALNLLKGLQILQHK